MKKLFCKQVLKTLEDGGTPIESYFAYINVTENLNNIIIETQRMRHFNDNASSEIVVNISNAASNVVFVYESQGQTKAIPPSLCSAQITNKGLLYTVGSLPGLCESKTDLINMVEINNYENYAEKVHLRYTANRSDHRSYEADCIMNSLSGELNIAYPLKEEIEDEYVEDPLGNRYSVFRCDKLSNKLFVSPSEISSLVRVMEENDCIQHNW